MRIACLYDVHANLSALEAVLREVDNSSVDHVIVGGDIVPGPQPREALHQLRTLKVPTTFISGNGEREVLALTNGDSEVQVPPKFWPAMKWCGSQLSIEEQKFLLNLPSTVHLEHPSFGKILFCHATPESDSVLFTHRTHDDRVSALFNSCDAPLAICGHTHMPFEKRVGNTRIVNAGSVGMAFGSPDAQWLLIDAEIEFRNTPYDRMSAATQIAATEYPDAEEFAANYISTFPDADQMVEVFELSAERTAE